MACSTYLQRIPEETLHQRCTLVGNLRPPVRSAYSVSLEHAKSNHGNNKKYEKEDGSVCTLGGVVCAACAACGAVGGCGLQGDGACNSPQSIRMPAATSDFITTYNGSGYPVVVERIYVHTLIQ